MYEFLLERIYILLGKKDSITKVYMRENAVFADIFNYFLYDGKPVLRPENLQAIDTTELAILYNDSVLFHESTDPNLKKHVLFHK